MAGCEKYQLDPKLPVWTICCRQTWFGFRAMRKSYNNIHQILELCGISCVHIVIMSKWQWNRIWAINESLIVKISSALCLCHADLCCPFLWEYETYRWVVYLSKCRTCVYWSIDKQLWLYLLHTPFRFHSACEHMHCEWPTVITDDFWVLAITCYL